MNLHPLIIPEILTNIFEYLDISDLLSMRHVCRVWNSETGQFIASRKLICIHSEAKLKELHDLFLENAKFPLRSFELWSFTLNLDSETTLKHISVVGPYLQYLTLNFDKEMNQITLRTLRDLLIYYLPNLKCLSIRQLPLSILSQNWIFPPQGLDKFRQPLLPSLKSLILYSDFDYNPNFLINFLSSTMNLEEIKVEYGDEPRDFKKCFLSALFTCGNQLQHLQSLQYFMHDPGAGPDWSWEPEECTKLAKMNFHLKSIKLHPAGGKAETRSLYALLEQLTTTLESVTLRVHQQLRCPIMTQLNSIVLYDYEGSLQFLDQLPSLRHLGLCEYAPAKYLTVETIVSNKKHYGIISLNLYGSYTVSTHLFRAIATILPSLKILHFWHINDEKLKIVIESFPSLEELTMNVVNVNDETFTGIPLEECEKMERLGNYVEISSSNAVSHGVNQLRTNATYIHQLQNLRKLEMHGACLAEWEWSGVSDVSIFMGLIHLHNLTSLSLYEFKWITDAGIKKICQMLPLLYLKIDSRVFSETILSDIKLIRPEMRLEYVTDDFEICSDFIR